MIDLLPDDIMEVLFQFLSEHRDIRQLMMVCKTIRNQYRISRISMIFKDYNISKSSWAQGLDAVDSGFHNVTSLSFSGSNVVDEALQPLVSNQMHLESLTFHKSPFVKNFGLHLLCQSPRSNTSISLSSPRNEESQIISTMNDKVTNLMDVKMLTSGELFTDENSAVEAGNLDLTWLKHFGVSKCSPAAREMALTIAKEATQLETLLLDGIDDMLEGSGLVALFGETSSNSTQTGVRPHSSSSSSPSSRTHSHSSSSNVLYFDVKIDSEELLQSQSQCQSELAQILAPSESDESKRLQNVAQLKQSLLAALAPRSINDCSGPIPYSDTPFFSSSQTRLTSIPPSPSIISRCHAFTNLRVLAAINSPCILDLSFVQSLPNLEALFLGGSRVQNGVYNSLCELSSPSLKVLELTFHDADTITQINNLHLPIQNNHDETNTTHHQFKIIDFCNFTADDIAQVTNLVRTSVTFHSLQLATSYATNATDRWRRTALHLAVTSGDFDRASLLVSLGCDIELKDRKGYTALARAADLGHANIVRLLLNAGANVNAFNHAFETPLFIACLKGHYQVAEVLLTMQEDVTVFQDPTLYNDGWTPGAAACVRGDIKILELIIHHNILPGIANKLGMTPLHIAVRRGFILGVEALVTAGQDGSQGYPSIHKVKSRTNTSEIRTLLSSLPSFRHYRQANHNKASKRRPRKKNRRYRRNNIKPENNNNADQLTSV